MPKNNLILIVDDEESFREIYSAALQIAGFNVETAKNSEETLKKASELKPALILMDIKMPGNDGIQTSLALKNNPETKDIKIVFLTNLGGMNLSEENTDKKYAQELGAYDYIKKSVDIKSIIEYVKKFFAPEETENL